MSEDGAEPAAEQSPPRKAHRRSAHSRDPAVRPSRWALTRWAAPAAVLIAVIALAAVAVIASAVAAWALLRPAPADNPPTEPQIAEAKERACAAYLTVRTAVALQTNPAPGTDPIQEPAIAANARLAMVTGSSYMLDHLDPATPPQLAKSMRLLATNLQDLAITAMAGRGSDDPEQLARWRDYNVVNAEVAELCK